MIIFIIILALTDIYAYRMVRQMRSLHRYIWVYWALNVLVYGYFLYSFLDLGILSHELAVYFRGFVITYYFSKFAFILPLILDDLRRIMTWIVTRFSKPKPPKVGQQSRKRFMQQMSVTLGAAPFMIMSYGVVRNIYRYRVIHQKLKVPDLHKDMAGLRIVQISDIHAGTFPDRKPVLKGIEMINELNPDVFVFTGDLVNSRADEIDPYIGYFSKVEARYGKFSIMGNHDYGDYHGWKTEREKQQNDLDFVEKHHLMGWDLLRNEHRTISIGESNLSLIGVENFSTIPRFPRKGDLSTAREGLGNTDFRLLLSHDPTHWNAEVTTDNQDIHLTLSGHTHGFQFGLEIPGIIKWSPAQYIYKKWAGLYQTKNQYLYVNRGYGVLGYPGRIGILPEITLIELENA